MIRVQRNWLDGLAIGASTLCLIHCLLLPALLIALPALATFLALPEDFHFWALVVAMPTSAFAMTLGYWRHRRKAPLLLAVSGLACLGAAELIFHATSQEVWVAVIGSLQLGFGHALNMRATRH